MAGKAGRPAVKRNVVTIDRDIKSLERLKMSLEKHGTSATEERAIQNINALIGDLRVLQVAAEAAQAA
jgi:hypothetical protein